MPLLTELAFIFCRYTTNTPHLRRYEFAHTTPQFPRKKTRFYWVNPQNSPVNGKQWVRERVVLIQNSKFKPQHLKTPSSISHPRPLLHQYHPIKPPSIRGTRIRFTKHTVRRRNLAAEACPIRRSQIRRVLQLINPRGHRAPR
jgi:hypothetical protein